MPRISFIVTVIGCALALTASAATIDGKWVLKETRKNKDGQERTTTTTLDLKSQGTQLTGTITRNTGRRDRTVDIQDGKVDGNKFSFTVLQKAKQEQVKILWEGAVEGDQLNGEQKREGARRARPFSFSRAGS